MIFARHNKWSRRFVSRDAIIGDVTNPGSLDWYTFVQGNPARIIDPLGLWGKDVHYVLTMELATNLGFSPEEAKTIAEGCQFVDYDRKTEPIWGDQSWHFDRSRVDNDPSNTDTRIVHSRQQQELGFQLMLDSSTYYQGLFEIGRGLHPLQDIDAHKDQGINKVGKIDSPHGEGWLNYFNLLPLGATGTIQIGMP